MGNICEVPTESEAKKLTQYELKEALAEHYPCFVLITSSEPDIKGQLSVEMCYEGDSSLAAYMVETAQEFIEVESQGE